MILSAGRPKISLLLFMRMSQTGPGDAGERHQSQNLDVSGSYVIVPHTLHGVCRQAWQHG
jgi:hypothetical protein